jgi:hypothetical protein
MITIEQLENIGFEKGNWCDEHRCKMLNRDMQAVYFIDEQRLMLSVSVYGLFLDYKEIEDLECFLNFVSEETV